VAFHDHWAFASSTRNSVFGVAHKERFKQLRETVDVLTLVGSTIP
jgi:hypothetical protein